ncbi:hypothetical protein [Pedobacter antarcticus]|uniref:hypothetical protein n=1 Tax=Pedobacter antarcticus TaxID=34086 RepID=UPI00292E7855|nr:hypothetical protein [Pedobacter antarcticus]
MQVKVNLDTIILYVQNVNTLKSFYTSIFSFSIVEEFQSVWVLLESGSCKIGLHQIGEKYLNKSKPAFKFDNNTKIVFEINQDINEIRSYLLSQHVQMREIKTFDDYNYWLCDGEDPEGNMFQLKQAKFNQTQN